MRISGTADWGMSGNKITVFSARSCCMLWCNKGACCCATVESHCDQSWGQCPHTKQAAFAAFDDIVHASTWRVAAFASVNIEWMLSAAEAVCSGVMQRLQ